MGCDVVEIDCWCSSVIYLLLHYLLSNFVGYKWTRHDGDLMVEFKIGGENIRINLTNHFKENIHVCVFDLPMDRLKKFSVYCREWTRRFFSRHPTVPIIILCFDAERKYDPDLMKEAELEGDEMIDRKSVINLRANSARLSISNIHWKPDEERKF